MTEPRTPRIAIPVLAAVAIVAATFLYLMLDQDTAEAPPEEAPGAVTVPDLASHDTTAPNKKNQPEAPASPRQNLRQRAMRMANNGNLQGAIDLLYEAYKNEPDNKEIRTGLARLCLAMGWKNFNQNDYKKARGFFEEAFFHDRRTIDAMRGMAMISFRQRDLAAAEDALEDYIEGGGDAADAFSLMGVIHYEDGRLEEALYYLEQSLTLNPRQPRVSELVGKIGRDIEVEAGFAEDSTSHFVFRYEGGEAPEVRDLVIEVCEDAYIEVGRMLGYYPDNPITVILYTDKQFQDVTGTAAWANGIFDGKIRIPAKGIKQRDLLVDRVVFHEYTHAVVHYLGQGRAPVWLQEGLAQIGGHRRHGHDAGSTGRIAPSPPAGRELPRPRQEIRHRRLRPKPARRRLPED